MVAVFTKNLIYLTFRGTVAERCGENPYRRKNCNPSR